MKYVIDKCPIFCPECGRSLMAKNIMANDGDGRTIKREDFKAGASAVCDCGAMWQYVPGEEITELAKNHGDAGLYW